MGEFLGVAASTWRIVLGIGCVLAATFLIGAVSEAVEHDWAGMAYLALMAVLVGQMVWRARHLARRDRLQ